jgi:hypothetical protein
MQPKTPSFQRPHRMRGWRVRALPAIVFSLFLVAAFPARSRADVRVPWIGQKTSTDCGRAVLASLKARRGGSPERHYASIRDPKDTANGYSISEMQRLGGLSVRSPAGIVIRGDCAERPAVTAHFAALRQIVGNGRPVVVPVSSGFGSGHYLILVGASGEGFRVHDPASPGLRSMSSSELARLMCGFGYVALVGR